MAPKKKIAVKRQVWNKGLQVGKREGFTPAQVKRIRDVLADRGVPGLRDLALFSLAIDTMLRGPELLDLTVKDVQIPNGTIRSVIKVARPRGKPPLRCALSEKTAKALGRWIAVSGVKGTDYIFPGQDAGRPRPMSGRQLHRLLKFCDHSALSGGAGPCVDLTHSPGARGRGLRMVSQCRDSAGTFAGTRQKKSGTSVTDGE